MLWCGFDSENVPKIIKIAYNKTPMRRHMPLLMEGRCENRWGGNFYFHQYFGFGMIPYKGWVTWEEKGILRNHWHGFDSRKTIINQGNSRKSILITTLSRYVLHICFLWLFCIWCLVECILMVEETSTQLMRMLLVNSGQLDARRINRPWFMWSQV